MKICRQSERIKLAFNLAECVDHVSKDIYDELHAHSAEYMQHTMRIKELQFADQEITDRQKTYFNFFNYDFGRLKDIICDRLWACGMLCSFQTVIDPAISIPNFLINNVHRIFQLQEYEFALTEVERSYNWMRMCTPETYHERWAEYRNEKYRGLRLIAIATTKHGFEFGIEVLNISGFQVKDADIKTFYDSFVNS